MNPSKVQARKMVLVSVALLFAITFYKDRRTSTPLGTFHAAWATGIVGMFLSLLADFVPQIAGPFAGLIVLGSLTSGGEQALAKILGGITPNPSGSGSGSTSPGPSSGSSSSRTTPAPVASTTGPAVKTTLPNG